MTYELIAQSEGCSTATIRRAAVKLFPELYQTKHKGPKNLTITQITAVKESLTFKEYNNNREVPLETIQRLYQKLLDNGKISAKECRETFGMVCNNSVYAAFENNYYNGKPMLFYEEREGGQIWLKRME